ncbi:hypothetical protein GMES_1111 [Paraglaciecola mesophila KMM 241]|uniref:Uncharacterized protein n=1 Tax=Paraglaciecola mesophila KMM 241 TaxID=1128912 RepID=K6ZJ54_9ALTE|nr:hypothetical protein GMES_1111 [Paraglaciecola mesophila KMM 241]
MLFLINVAIYVLVGKNIDEQYLVNLFLYRSVSYFGSI